MGKKRGCKRTISSSDKPANPVKVKTLPTLPQPHPPIASSGQYQDKPWNQSTYEFHDPWMSKVWIQQPTYPNPWPFAHWDQRTNYGNLGWPYSKPYQTRYMVDPYFHYYLHSFPHQFPTTVPSYYRRNGNLASHSQSKTPAHKNFANGSGNLATFSVHTDVTLPSSNDTASTVELDSSLPSSNVTTITVDLHASLPTNNKAGYGSKRVSKEPSPLRTVKVNRTGSLQVQVVNNAEEEEDVCYLYSVEPTQGKLVELVDLSENLHVPSNQDLLDPDSKTSYFLVNSDSKSRDYSLLKHHTGDNPCNTLILNKKSVYSQNTHEQHCGDTCCNICLKSLIQLQNNQCDLYSARCGHLFCVLCIKRLNIQNKCMKCNELLSRLRKIVL